MIVENETRWDTRDLRELSEEIVRHYNLRIESDRLLLFVTLRRPYRGKMTTFETNRGNRTSVVKIASPETVNADQRALDQIASSVEAARQAPNQMIRILARDIVLALEDNYWSSKHKDAAEQAYEWTDKFNFRQMRRNTDKRPLSIQRKIVCLEKVRNDKMREHNKEIAKLNRQIGNLRGKL